MASSSDVTALLHKELSNRNIDFSIREDGAYEIEINGYQTVMNVEDFARVCDSGQIVEFVDALVSAATHLKTWETAKPGIRFMAAAAGVDFGEAVYEEISDTLCRLLVHIDPVNGIVSRLMAGTIIEWGQTKEAVEAAAASNMRDMLTQSEIRIEQFEGHRIGIVSAEFFNASVLFSPNLRELVEPSLGWPVFALIPSQDSCYIVPKVDEELLPQLGPMIVREFETEDDPVSTEVFVVSDSGILSIASFDDDSDDSEQDVSDSGMRTIDYGDGAIRFRIPAHWGEEHQDDCGLFFEIRPIPPCCGCK